MTKKEELCINAKSLVKWILFSLMIGIAVGAVGAVFGRMVTYATLAFRTYSWLLYLLPFAGLVIVAMYRFGGFERDPGTNRVLQAVRGTQTMPVRMAPMIVLATVLTHLCGGSSGREGAALQLGAALSTGLGKFIPLNEDDSTIFKVSGMAAGFAALFGTPMAAAVFAIECISIGKMQYAALFPCLMSAIVARITAGLLGSAPEAFHIGLDPALTSLNVVRAMVLGLCCALIARLFCLVLHKVHELYHHFLPNPYASVFVGGCLVAACSLLLGTRDYNGAGMDVIEHMLENGAMPAAFLIKLLLTALTLCAGFKGGEIVPAFFTGAAFGAAFGGLLGLSPAFAGGACMIGVFCGVTNCPLASILLAYELFGGTGLPLIALVAALSFMLSGYSSLYSEQIINYHKLILKPLGRTSGELTSKEKD